MKLSPDPNSTYSFSVITKLNTTLVVNSQKVEKLWEANIALTYSFLSSPAGSTIIRMTFDNLVLKSSEKGREDIIDASNGQNSFDPIEKILGNIIGKSLTVTIDSGKVIDVDGSQAIMSDILKSVETSNVQIRKRVEEQVSNLVGETFIKNSVLEMFGFYPDSAIHVDQSWKQKSLHSAGVDYEINTVYTLSSIRNGIAQIDVSGNIEAPKNSDPHPGNYQYSSNIRGDQQGYIKLDTLSGVLTEARNTSTISGTINVMGTEVPMEITVLKNVVGKKR